MRKKKKTTKVPVIADKEDLISGHNSTHKKWFEKPIGIISLTVISGLIVVYVTYHFGWNGPKEEERQIREQRQSAKHPLNLQEEIQSAPSASTLAAKEYIFGNQYFYLQVLTDKSGRVLAYGVTTRKADFNPSFKILEHAYTADKASPEDFSKAVPLVFNVTLGKTHFSDFPHSPEDIYTYLGARRLYYHEEYYFGNPGNYQSYYLGINDSGYVDLDENSLEFLLNKGKIEPNDKIVSDFRKHSTVNTFLVTSPMGGFETALRKYLIGPDLDQVRVISEAALMTKETKSSLLGKMKSLSTEINIQLYITRFGQPLIVNDHPYLDIRNDRSLHEIMQ